MKNINSIIIDKIYKNNLNEIKCPHCGFILNINEFLKMNQTANYCGCIFAWTKCAYYRVYPEFIHFERSISKMPKHQYIISIHISTTGEFTSIYDIMTPKEEIFSSNNILFSNLSDNDVTMNEFETILTFQ